jgi:hypothetical protein
MLDAGFPVVRTSAATGRHKVVVAFKSGTTDLRPDSEDRAKDDYHVATVVQDVAKVDR